jgi:hypothetical protein
MFYRLLGIVVWRGARVYFWRKYGGRPPVRLLAALGGLLVLGAGVAALVTRNSGDSD